MCNTRHVLALMLFRFFILLFLLLAHSPFPSYRFGFFIASLSHSRCANFLFGIFLVAWPRRVWCHYNKLTCKRFLSASKLNKNNIRPQVISSASSLCFSYLFTIIVRLILSLCHLPYLSKTACISVSICDERLTNFLSQREKKIAERNEAKVVCKLCIHLYTVAFDAH